MSSTISEFKRKAFGKRLCNMLDVDTMDADNKHPVQFFDDEFIEYTHKFLDWLQTVRSFDVGNIPTQAIIDELINESAYFKEVIRACFVWPESSLLQCPLLNMIYGNAGPKTQKNWGTAPNESWHLEYIGGGRIWVVKRGPSCAYIRYNPLRNQPHECDDYCRCGV